MEEMNEGVIVESSATEPEVTETPEAVTGEESAASETDAAPAQENAVTEGESAAPQKPDAKARIRQLHAERERAKEEAAYWRGKAEGKVEPEKAPVANQEDPEPTPEQFPDYDGYVKAQARWEARQEFKALEAQKEQRAKERETQTREEQVETSFKERVQGFKAKTPDFDSIMQNPELRISKTMYEAIREAEVGPQIAYHLGNNPGEAARIAALSPIAAIREIGKLEAKFEKAPAQAVKTISNAPAPPSTVQGNTAVQKDPSKMTDAEWYEHWKAEKKAGRK